MRVMADPAEQDLDTIVEHIAKDNLQAALDMDDLLRDCADGLVSFPKKGKPGRVPGTREFVAHRKYILVYVVTVDAIQIVAVLHAARQWSMETVTAGCLACSSAKSMPLTLIPITLRSR